MNTLELLRDITDRLRSSPNITSPELEAKWILERALGLSQSQILVGVEFEVDSPHRDFIESASRRRLEGVPLAYILGEKDFYGLTFLVNPNVLIPRPETELLVDHAIKWARPLMLAGMKHVRAVDFGAGSGCLGLSFLKNVEVAELCAIDTSVEALDVFDFNMKSLGLHERAHALFMPVENLSPEDLPESFQGQVDLVLANPPYIAEDDAEVDDSVRRFEPSAALFADEDGFGAIRRWTEKLKYILAAKALVLFEIGYQQGPKAKEIFQQTGLFSKVEVLRDYSDRDRVIRAERV